MGIFILRIAVCEDDSKDAKNIFDLLDKYASDRHGIDFITQSFSSGSELLKSIEAGQIFDLLLLDIVMRGLSGIGLARKLRAEGYDTPLIFLTSSVDYALDAFRVSATQYILKPIREDELFAVLDKVSAGLKRKEERCFMLQMSAQTVKVPCSSIIYVELTNRKLMVFLESGRTLQSKVIRMPFAEAVEPLIEDNRFLCAHKSFVINMAHVEKLTGNSFVMDNGAEIHIPRYNCAKAKARYFEWLSAQGIGFLGGALT